MRVSQHTWHGPLIGFALVMVSIPAHAAPATAPPAGLRESSPRVHAIVGAKIVVSPDKTIDKGTLVVRDGVIVAVGENVETPADARVHDAQGKTLYPGLIDAYGELSSEASRTALEDGRRRLLEPARRAASACRLDVCRRRGREQEAARPGHHRAARRPFQWHHQRYERPGEHDRGRGKQVILKDQVALRLKLTTWRGRGYPNSPMGA